MRHIQRTEKLRRAMRGVSGKLALALLIAAMLSPLVSAALGWAITTPLDVPLSVHVVILAAFAAAIWFESRRDRARWALLLGLTIAFAALLHLRSNAFYTARALMEGMAVLLVLELCFRELRRRAVVYGIRVATPCETDPRPSHAVGDWSGSILLTRAPSIRLADRLSAILGWSLLASWILIALEHRHVVGPLLLVAGVLQVLAIVMLIPDAFAAHLIARRPVRRRREPSHARIA